MNEPFSLSTKTPIIAASLLFVLLLVAAVIVNWDSQFSRLQDDIMVQKVRYLGDRGYFKPPAGNEALCKTQYSFWAYIEGNVVHSSDETMSFVVNLDEAGQLQISGSDVVPVPEYDFQISGPIQNARMFSELCGEGYFKLNRDPD